MDIGVIKIDFTIVPELNPQIIKICDNSDWFSAENKQSTLYIIPPGSTKANTSIFAKHKINTYNSTNLQLSCLTECGENKLVDLTDGIYTIILKSAYEGIEKTRYHLKTDRFMVEWYKEWASTGLTYVDSKNPKYDALMDSRKHLITAEAYTIEGNFVLASREFQEAQKKFNKIRKCKDCY